MTPSVLLTREAPIPDGVFGELLVYEPGHNLLDLKTCEDDWRDNQPGVSCIPAGTYPLRRSFFHHGGYEAFEICDVPGRSHILIHKGNTEENTEGCVLLGMRFSELEVAKDEDTGEAHVTKVDVAESKEAFDAFMAALDGVQETTITIQWERGAPESSA